MSRSGSTEKVEKHQNIEDVAVRLRHDLGSKKNILLFAYNGIGKTRISMAFKDLGKKGYNRDTLYFNAFTEDLFTWDNDLDSDNERMLRLNSNSKFFKGLVDWEMDNRIRPLLGRYADFDFRIDTDKWEVRFSREVKRKDSSITLDDIKISRGEEIIFIWCFFLAVVRLAMDKDITAYSWVKYIYIDDPISSLDENNAVAVAHHLAKLFTDEKNTLKVVISTHHTLFFNVLYNEFHRTKGNQPYFLRKSAGTYTLDDIGDTPFFYHVAMLVELKKAADTDSIYTYHFNMLRIILEKTASFHGYKKFDECIMKEKNDPDGLLHARQVNVLSHGNYSLYEPVEMMQDSKDMFKKILNNFLKNYNFNTEAFKKFTETEEKA